LRVPKYGDIKQTDNIIRPISHDQKDPTKKENIPVKPIGNEKDLKRDIKVADFNPDFLNRRPRVGIIEGEHARMQKLIDGYKKDPSLDIYRGVENKKAADLKNVVPLQKVNRPTGLSGAYNYRRPSNDKPVDNLDQRIREINRQYDDREAKYRLPGDYRYFGNYEGNIYQKNYGDRFYRMI